MPKHTPGPWKRGKGSFAANIVTGNDEQQKTIAELWYFGHDREAIQANACLIAAAPDLLAACRTALDALGCDRVRQDRLEGTADYQGRYRQSTRRSLVVNLKHLSYSQIKQCRGAFA